MVFNKLRVPLKLLKENTLKLHEIDYNFKMSAKKLEDVNI